MGQKDFVDAGQAWQAAPRDEDLPRYGYGPDLRGRWTVRWELTRDLAALTGFEPLTSDVWGVVTSLPDDDPAAADDAFARAAIATEGGGHGTRAQWLALAADPAFAVPPVITTAPYLTGRVYQVDLAADGSRGRASPTPTS